MATLDIVHVGDTGTVIEKTVQDDGLPVDLSAATTITLKLNAPGGSPATTLTGSFVTDGTDGKIKFTTVAGTWPESGEWKEQVYIVDPSGAWHAEAEERVVMPTLL